MDYKEVFEALKNLDKLRGQKPVESKFVSDYDEYGDKYEIYKVGEDYIKLTVYEDSYGDDKGVTGIEIVKPKKVILTDFETVNI